MAPDTCKTSMNVNRNQLYKNLLKIKKTSMNVLKTNTCEILMIVVYWFLWKKKNPYRHQKCPFYNSALHRRIINLGSYPLTGSCSGLKMRWITQRFGTLKKRKGENSTHCADLKVKNLQLKIELCVLIVCVLVVFLSYTF